MSEFAKFNIDPSLCGNTEDKTNYPQVPIGIYHVSIKSLQLKASKAGNPMLSVQFVIESGEYKGNFLFMNSILMRDGTSKDLPFVARCNNFLRSLQMIDNCRIQLDHETGVQGYEAMVNDIARRILEQKPTFALDYNEEHGKDGKSYQRFTITDMYPSS